MFEKILPSNEIIGLTILLLMVMALVASPAGTALEDEARAETTVLQAEEPVMPLSATIRGHINGKVLTVSVDTMIRFGLLRFESTSE